MSTNFDSMEDVVNRAAEAGAKLISPELKDHLSNIGESLGEIGLTRSQSLAPAQKLQGLEMYGGEGGIRTLGTGVSPYNGLANRRIRPLCHLSGVRKYSLARWA